MNRTASAQRIVVAALVGVLGCGGAEAERGPATVTPVTVPPPSAERPHAPSPPEVVEADRPPVNTARTAPPPSEMAALPQAGKALPPPKPTTLPLATRTGDPVDEALVNGDQAFENGDLAAAAREYESAKNRAPKRAAPVVGLARVRIAKVGAPLDYGAAKGNKEIAAASRDLKRASQMEPSFGPAYVEYGRALLLLGDAGGAIDALRRGVQLVPDEAEAHSALGVALLASGGRRDESLSELQKAADLDPGSAARHGNLGTVLLMNGKVPEAIKEYETRLSLDDKDPVAHSDLASALLAHNETARAIGEIQKAVAIDPQRATFRVNLGYALQMDGKRADAVAAYREAIRLDPKLVSAWIGLATALARDPQTRGEARAALEKARSIDPTDPRVKANLQELDALEKGSRSP